MATTSDTCQRHGLTGKLLGLSGQSTSPHRLCQPPCGYPASLRVVWEKVTSVRPSVRYTCHRATTAPGAARLRTNAPAPASTGSGWSAPRSTRARSGRSGTSRARARRASATAARAATRRSPPAPRTWWPGRSTAAWTTAGTGTRPAGTRRTAAPRGCSGPGTPQVLGGVLPIRPGSRRPAAQTSRRPTTTYEPATAAPVTSRIISSCAALPGRLAVSLFGRPYSCMRATGALYWSTARPSGAMVSHMLSIPLSPAAA